MKFKKFLVVILLVTGHNIFCSESIEKEKVAGFNTMLEKDNTKENFFFGELSELLNGFSIENQIFFAYVDAFERENEKAAQGLLTILRTFGGQNSAFKEVCVALTKLDETADFESVKTMVVHHEDRNKIFYYILFLLREARAFKQHEKVAMLEEILTGFSQYAVSKL